jgi:hypothetical protein
MYGGIAAPKINSCVDEGLAGLDIDHLDVNGHWDAAFALRQVPSDLLTLDVCSIAR